MINQSTWRLTVDIALLSTIVVTLITIIANLFRDSKDHSSIKKEQKEHSRNIQSTIKEIQSTTKEIQNTTTYVIEKETEAVQRNLRYVASKVNSIDKFIAVEAERKKAVDGILTDGQKENKRYLDAIQNTFRELEDSQIKVKALEKKVHKLEIENQKLLRKLGMNQDDEPEYEQEMEMT